MFLWLLSVNVVMTLITLVFFRLKPCHTDRCVLTESVGCKCVKRLFSHLSHSTEVGLAAHS